MVGQKLCFLRNTVVTLDAGPEVLWATVALHGIYEKRNQHEIEEKYTKYIGERNKTSKIPHMTFLLFLPFLIPVNVIAVNVTLGL